MNLKSIIVANWKMNLSPQEATGLARAIKGGLAQTENKDIVLCPSYVALAPVFGIIKDANLFLGAQDAFWQVEGSYTGEVSPRNLYDLGCRYVILGHSERRKSLGETDEMINKKIDLCLDEGLHPIVCVGEDLEERESKQTDSVVYSQITKAFKNIDLVPKESLVVAYEPIWSIGTGKEDDAEHINYVFSVIRQALIDIWPDNIVSNNIRFIYGGSVNNDNIESLMNMDLNNGFLIGKASLNAEAFTEIIKKI